MKRRLKEIKEHIWIFFGLLILVLISLGIQKNMHGLDKDFWLSLIPNIIIDCVFILIVSYLISFLTNKNEIKKTKVHTFKILNLKYDRLVHNIAKNYINYISKKPTSLSSNISTNEGLTREILSITENINLFVTDNFLRQHVTFLTVKSNEESIDITDIFQEVSVPVQKFTFFFKSQTIKEIDEFLLKYGMILPDDLRERLFNLDSLLQVGIFVTPEEQNIILDVSNAEFSQNEFQEIIKELGLQIYELLIYFEDLKVDNKSFTVKSSPLEISEILIMFVLFLLLIQSIIFSFF